MISAVKTRSAGGTIRYYMKQVSEVSEAFCDQCEFGSEVEDKGDKGFRDFLFFAGGIVAYRILSTRSVVLE